MQRPEGETATHTLRGTWVHRIPNTAAPPQSPPVQPRSARPRTYLGLVRVGLRVREAESRFEGGGGSGRVARTREQRSGEQGTRQREEAQQVHGGRTGSAAAGPRWGRGGRVAPPRRCAPSAESRRRPPRAAGGGGSGPRLDAPNAERRCPGQCRGGARGQVKASQETGRPSSPHSGPAR